jgi:formamidopyrimidine-DNA glycosylase
MLAPRCVATRLRFTWSVDVGPQAHALTQPLAPCATCTEVPELPEVEVTRRELEPQLLGRTITKVVTTSPSYFFITAPSVLRKKLPGRTAVRLERMGKYLLLELDDSSRLLLHLGMTGQLFFSGQPSLRLMSALRGVTLAPEQQVAQGFVPDGHTHIVLSFEDAGCELYFRDVRKFGKVELLAAGAVSARLDKLGVDALIATGSVLAEAVRGRKTSIKTVLLDQSVLAGVGNIYADEALFLAGVNPARKATRVKPAECDAIVAAVRQVMLRSIETGGSSISDYVRPQGERGSYQDERKVYARSKLPCGVCGTVIKRRMLGQRSTHWCPSCQTK